MGKKMYVHMAYDKRYKAICTAFIIDELFYGSYLALNDQSAAD